MADSTDIRVDPHHTATTTAESVTNKSLASTAYRALGDWCIYAHELPEDKGRVAEGMASLNPPMAVNQT